MSKYSEHDKLKAISDKSQTCGEFLNWLKDDQGLSFARWFDKRYICAECGEVPEEEIRTSGVRRFHKNNNERCDGDVEYVSAGFQPDTRGVTELLASFFEINQRKIEDEKCAMFDECRAANP